MPQCKPRATQVLPPIDGGKLAAVFGQKSLNSRNCWSTSRCTHCHFNVEPFRLLREAALEIEFEYRNGDEAVLKAKRDLLQQPGRRRACDSQSPPRHESTST